MLSRLLVVLYLFFGSLFVVYAQSSTSQSIVCVVGQCLQGYTNISLGEILSAQGDTSVHLLPGQYTSTTNPPLLHTLLTSSSATLSPSPGFNLSSVNPLPLNIALQSGISIYSNPFFGGQAAFSHLPSSPINSSIPLPASSVALADNIWVALTSGSSSNPIIFWDTIPDVSQLPPEASLPLAIVNIQSSTCSPPCAGSGICTASGTCTCPAGFTGSSCEACAEGFFGPNCQPCPSKCEKCDQGTSGSGLCFTPTIGNTPETCNCVNGQCNGNGTCTCTPGWIDAANGTACAQCAQGFFLASNGDCQICQNGCSECADDTGACTSCSQGFSQDQNDETLCNPLQSSLSDGTPCPDGSYIADNKCLLCSPSCQTCNGPSADNCIVCAAQLSLFQGTCVNTDPSTGICEGTNGMVVNNGKQECDTCGAKCTSCKIPNFTAASTISQVLCTGCLPGFFLSQGQCVASCPSGTFVSPQDNLTCTACSSSCSTCLGSADHCLTCANEQLSSAGQCVSACPTGTFSSSGACLQCHPDCASCTGSSFNQCSSCSPKLPVLTAGRCLPTCGQSEFFDLTSSTCKDCDSSCSSCSDSGPTHCLACSSSTQVLRAGSCVSANCTGSDVIPDLGVCLSDLVQLPPASTTTTTTSSVPRPSTSGVSKSNDLRHKVPWWQILLMVLGCVFILILILLLWRRHARKQREEETVMFASARHLDGGDGWRWRLRQFRQILFGGKKGGYDADDPSLTYDGDAVSPPRLPGANLNIQIHSPKSNQYSDNALSPHRPPRSIHRPLPSPKRYSDHHPSSTRRRSSNPPPRRRYRSGDSSPTRGWLSDDSFPPRHLSDASEPPIRKKYLSGDPSPSKRYRSDEPPLPRSPVPRRYRSDDPSSPRGLLSDGFSSPRRFRLDEPSLPRRYRSDDPSSPRRYLSDSPLSPPTKKYHFLDHPSREMRRRSLPKHRWDDRLDKSLSRYPQASLLNPDPKHSEQQSLRAPSLKNYLAYLSPPPSYPAQSESPSEHDGPSSASST